MRDIERLEIRSIAIPLLGCGLGGLDWNEVFPLMQAKLAGLGDVRILIYAPSDASPGTLIHDTHS